MFRSRLCYFPLLLLGLLLGFSSSIAKRTPAPAHAPAPPPVIAPPLTLVPHTPRYFFSLNVDPFYQLVGSGEITEDQAKRANHYRFTYNTDGTLARIEFFRTEGHPQSDPTFSVPRIDISSAEDPASHQKTIRRFYMDANGQPDRDGEGVFGEELRLNATGGVTDILNLDDHQKPMLDAEGVSHYVRKLDAQNRVIALTRFAMGSSGSPEQQVRDQDGYYETRTVYDDHNRPVERTNYDASGARLKNGDGIATTRTVYTLFPDFIKVQESYFAVDGMAVLDPKGVHMRIYQHDKRDFIISEAYYDVRGAACFDNEILSGEVPLAAYDYLHLYNLPNEMDQIHGKRFTYDDFGNLVKIQYLGLDDQPKEVKSTGYAEVRNTFDDQNRLIEQGFYGDDGNPVLSRKLGVAFVKQEYGPDGSLERCEYFDALHKPIDHKGYGVPAIEIKVVKERTYIFLQDADGKPAPNPAAGFYSLSYLTADDQPLSKHNTYYDANNQRLTRLNLYLARYLHALHHEDYERLSARLGSVALALGAFLAAFTSLRKTLATINRRSFMPSKIPRILSIIAYYLIAEGIVRMLFSIYWYIDTQNEIAVNFNIIYIVELALLIYFSLRVRRIASSLRIYNIARDDLKDVLKKFFVQAGVAFELSEKPFRFTSKLLSVDIRYFRKKRHAALNLVHQGDEGLKLRHKLGRFVRKQVIHLKSPSRRILFLVYYPLQTITYVTLCIFGLISMYLLLQA